MGPGGRGVVERGGVVGSVGVMVGAALDTMVAGMGALEVMGVLGVLGVMAVKVILGGVTGVGGKGGGRGRVRDTSFSSKLYSYIQPGLYSYIQSGLYSYTQLPKRNDICGYLTVIPELQPGQCAGHGQQRGGTGRRSPALSPKSTSQQRGGTGRRSPALP